jgi:hypothetical protein
MAPSGSSRLLGTAEGLQKTSRWVMQREILGQFRGARGTLYGPPISFLLYTTDLILF